MLSWLRSTIEGDKAAAEAAAAPRKGRYNIVDADGNRQFDHTPRPYNGEWRLSENRDAVMPSCPEADAVVSGSCGCCCPTSQGQEADLAHIATHDPRDTIARCEAELALLDEHAVEDTGFGKYCRVCSEYSTKPGEESELEPAGAPCRTVRILACGYENRDGFDPTLVLDPAELAAMLAGAEERRKQPLRPDDLGELQARLDALRQQP